MLLYFESSYKTYMYYGYWLYQLNESFQHYHPIYVISQSGVYTMTDYGNGMT